jgi:hypothetical protein
MEKRKYTEINQGFIDLADQISKNEQVVKSCNILFLNYDTDKKELFKKNKMIERKLANRLIRVNRLRNMQFEALSSFLPKPNDPLMTKLGREMPSRTIANGYPFINSAIDDDKGMVIGPN